MATITFDLVDSEGHDAEIGDIIETTIPEIELMDRYGEPMFIRPTMTVRAKILFPPSKGLQLRILEVVKTTSNEDNPKPTLAKGDRISFPRTVWYWKTFGQ